MGFVVGLDIVEVVEIVDHEAGAVVQSLFRDVAQPAHVFDTGAVAEVEAGHRIRRPARGIFSFEQIGRQQALQLWTQFGCDCRVVLPSGLHELLEFGHSRMRAFQPSHETRHR